MAQALDDFTILKSGKNSNAPKLTGLGSVLTQIGIQFSGWGYFVETYYPAQRIVPIALSVITGPGTEPKCPCYRPSLVRLHMPQQLLESVL